MRTLSTAGVTGRVEIRLLPGGANNRVYRVDTDQGPLLGKVYFRHPGDLRDRLKTETAFLEYSRQLGLKCVPRLLASDPAGGAALMEFIPGRKLAPGAVTWARVAEAIAFFILLNQRPTAPAAGRLSEASEACFSLDAHLACVEKRLQRLRSLRGTTRADRDALRFIQSDLDPAWASVSRSIRSSARGAAWRISPADRCVSPSDFGFHNALRRPDGRLCFIDFEYAGWDDPAKTVCDFFCQPAVPVDRRHLDRFVDGISRGFHRPERLERRVLTLLPAYALKWCCILLNEFLPVSGARRKFASKEGNAEDRKAGQLAKAKAALKRLDL